MAWIKQYGGEDGTTPYWVDPATGATSRTQPTQDTPNFQTRPTAAGGLETFNPQTGQFEASYRLPGDSGVSFVPAGLASQYPGAFLVDKNAAAQNRGGFVEDYALPAIIGGIATAGVGSMLGAGSLFGGGATSNALTDAVGGGAYSPGSANALTDALTSGYNSGTAIGASGAGTQLAGAIPAAEAGAMDAGAFLAGETAGAGTLGAAGFNPDPYITDVGTSGTGAADFSGLAGPASSLPSWMNAIKPYTPLIGGALSAGGALLFVDIHKSLLVDKTFNKQNVLSRTEFWTRQGSLGQ